MAGFLPVGSFPVASVPAGSGSLTNFEPGGALIQINAHQPALEHTNLAVRVYQFHTEALQEYDPYLRVHQFHTEALQEYDPYLNVYGFNVEVLREVKRAGRRMSLM